MSPSAQTSCQAWWRSPAARPGARSPPVPHARRRTRPAPRPGWSAPPVRRRRSDPPGWPGYARVAGASWQRRRCAGNGPAAAAAPRRARSRCRCRTPVRRRTPTAGHAGCTGRTVADHQVRPGQLGQRPPRPVDRHPGQAGHRGTEKSGPACRPSSRNIRAAAGLSDSYDHENTARRSIARVAPR